MPAKLVSAFSDEIPDFEKQFGCMTGIFQIFDRNHLLTGRRSGRHGQKRLPPGQFLSKSSTNVRVQNSSTPKIVLEKTFSKSMTENSSLSMESSRASCSSSSCSSFSSLDGNKSIQQELPFINEELFQERALKNSPRSKSSPAETKNTANDLRCATTKPGHPRIDFRDIVKESINRDSRGLTVKTSVKEEPKRNRLNHKDSPRPLLLSKSMDGTYVIGIDRSTKVAADVSETGRPLREHSRFSCDDRQFLRPGDPQDNKRSAAKLKELPRLSLDSRKESLRSSVDSKRNSLWKDFGYSRTDDALLDALKPPQQESPSHRRSNSLIAKLMGLEETPRSNRMLIADSYAPARSPRPVHDAKDERPLRSPRSRCRDSGTPPLKNRPSALTTKPSPRTLPQAAPWRQQDRDVANNNTACEHREAEPRPRTASVYTDIERRLKELEFLESNKDLRALRILGALHARDTRDGGQSSSQTPAKHAAQKTDAQRNRVPRDFKSPIVIMKPAKSTVKSDVSLPAVAPFAGLKGLRKNEGNTSEKTHSRVTRTHSRTEEPVSNTSSPWTPSSLSPRLMQKKADSEKRSRPPVPPSNKKSNESVSPRGKTKSKTAQLKNSCDEQVLQISENKISMRKQVDVSVMDRQKPLDVESSFVQQSVPSPSSRIGRNAAPVLNHEEPSLILGDHTSDRKLHPLENIQSPVSVLDASFYHDETSPSLRRISDSFKDGETHTSDEAWNPISLPDTPPSKTSSEVNQMKPENLEALIQKLEQLRSEDDEAPTTGHIMSSVAQNKDQQYIYEILSASGLLHKDIGFTPMPVQLRPTSYPINPDLFLVLEQTKSDSVPVPEAVNETNKKPKANTKMLHRRLIFDLVNETIAEKMESSGSAKRTMWFVQSKKLSGWQLFKDLCREIDALQEESSRVKISEEDDDENLLSAEDALRQMKEWKNFDSDLQGMVLDIERSIFKDLIDEVMGGEAADKMQHSERRLRRQLSFGCII